jgi:hypothetical protein
MYLSGSTIAGNSQGYSASDGSGIASFGNNTIVDRNNFGPFVSMALQ